jgi:hypothetical protein
MDEPSAEALIFNVIAYGALATVFLYAVFNIFKPVPKKSHLAIAPPWGTDEEFAFPPVSVATNSTISIVAIETERTLSLMFQS